MYYKRMEYIDAAETMISATRDDGSTVLIEPHTGDLWTLATEGTLGSVYPFVPKEIPPQPQKREPVIDYFKLAMVAARAVANGMTDPTDDEILQMVRAAK